MVMTGVYPEASFWLWFHYSPRNLTNYQPKVTLEILRKLINYLTTTDINFAKWYGFG